MTLLERAKIAKKEQETWQLKKDTDTLQNKLWSILSLPNVILYPIVIRGQTPFVKIEKFWFALTLDKRSLIVITKDGVTLKIEYLADLTKIAKNEWSLGTQELYRELEKLNGR